MYIEVYIDRDRLGAIRRLEKFFKWQKSEGQLRKRYSQFVHRPRNFGAKVQKYL